MQEFLSQLTGPNLKEKRERVLLTQGELAMKVGVTKHTIWSWENGKKQPSIKHLRVLKAFFSTQTV